MKGDLALRIGLHSGPVTAGVLRGQKSRFQLFGDTVNTASRMESTGMVNRIQCSKATADLLTKADKKHWITERFDRVSAKGKGTLQTYWVDPPHGEGHKPKGILKGKAAEQMAASGLDMRTDRLVGWLEVVLQQQLQKIVARRNALMRNPGWVEWNERSSGMVIDEIAEVVRFTPFDDQIQAELVSDDFHDVKLPPRVEEQLRKYIQEIAKQYHLTNSFHNFEHAAYVYTIYIYKYIYIVFLLLPPFDFRRVGGFDVRRVGPLYPGIFNPINRPFLWSRSTLFNTSLLE